jgi:DNA invertase Pin-like site-specific DNA recombinase
MTSIAAYVRISQDSTGERWGVETQRKKIVELAKLREWTIVEWYEDNDVSASKPRGPKSAWARMLRDAEARRFGTVVAVDVDRLLRSTKDLNTLIDYGLKVVTVDGEIDLSTADGEFRASMLASIARFEARRKAERTRRSNARRREEGMPVLSGKTPFGYTKSGDVVKEQKEAVEKAFDDFLGDRNAPIVVIARELNEAGHRTARGTEWSPYAVRYLLSNWLYAGFIEYHETGELYPVKEGVFPPLVGEDTVRAARAKLDDNARRTSKRGNQPKYLLSGVALCGKCGAKMVAGQNERRVPNYRCGEKFHVSRQREPVDAQVNAAAIARLSAEDAAEYFAPPEDAAVDRGKLRTDRAALRSRQGELKSLMVDPSVPLVEVKKASVELQKRIDEIDAQLSPPAEAPWSEIIEAGSAVADDEERVAVVESAWWSYSVERRRAIVDGIMTVTIKPIKPGHTRYDPALVVIELKRRS